MELKVIYDKQDTYREQFIKLLNYCFKMCKDQEFIDDWESVDENKIILGAVEGDELAGTLTLTNRTMYLDGQGLKVYGLGGVATGSTYRSGGVCSNLIKYSLEYMNKEGAVFSILAPFSYSFYEKLGWKWCYEYNTHCFDIERLKGIKANGKIDKLNDANFKELNTYYHAMVQGINGAAARNKVYWNKRICPGDDRYTVLYRNSEGTVEGYMIYKIVHEQAELQVLEIQYSTMSAIKSFLSYIYAHSAQVTKVMILAQKHNKIQDLLANPKYEVKQESYMMTRIINVEKALEKYTFNKTGELTIQVEDNMCEWNNGIFTIVIEETASAKVKKQSDSKGEGAKVDIKIDVRELAQLMLGFRTLEDLEELEKVEINNEEVKAYFKGQQSKIALYDFF